MSAQTRWAHISINAGTVQVLHASPGTTAALAGSNQIAVTFPAGTLISNPASAVYRGSATVALTPQAQGVLVQLTSASAAVELLLLSGPGLSLDVREAGAVGDGSYDCYDALQLSAALMSLSGGGILLFPPGIYHIARYIGDNNPSGPATHIVYRGCHGLQISGYGAHIDVNGSFFRSKGAATGIPGAFTSPVDQVSPFVMSGCSRFSIEGLEIDGNVDQCTRDPAVVEGNGIGVWVMACSNYRLVDLDIHHFITDGIYLGNSTDVRDADALLMNVRSANNARSAMSIQQLRGGLFLGCRFLDSGMTGAYGAHSPIAGVNVEPAVPGGYPVGVQHTGDLLFQRCEFGGNGVQFSAGHAETDRVTLDHCTVTNPGNADARCDARGLPPSSSERGYVKLGALVTEVRGCDFDLGTGFIGIYNGWDTVDNTPPPSVTRTLLEGCEIRSSGFGLLLDRAKGAELVVEGCRFVGTHTPASLQSTSGPQAQPFILGCERGRFRRNEISRSGIAAPQPGYSAVVVTMPEVADNRYTSDGVAPSASLLVSYDFPGDTNVGPIVARIEGERFDPAFYPERVPGWNHAFDYDRGVSWIRPRHGGVGSPNIPDPATGQWSPGDVFFVATPTPGGYAGFICVAGGPPPVWKRFGLIEP